MILEKIVYLELLRKEYTVYTGKAHDKEVGFLLE
jgi:predicted AAA+ superfamily ATPase